MLVLALLDTDDMYGYQLIQEISRTSNGALIFQEGSLYPVLYRLEDQGMITSYSKRVGKRMTRIYYHLEPQGRARVHTLAKGYRELVGNVFLIIRDLGEKETDGGE